MVNPIMVDIIEDEIYLVMMKAVSDSIGSSCMMNPVMVIKDLNLP